jgi:hypothetical protein
VPKPQRGRRSRIREDRLPTDDTGPRQPAHHANKITPLRHGPDRRLGAQELPGASVTYSAHISHSGAQLEPQAGKGVIFLRDQQLLAS